MNIILCGPPGSGKGTQANLLCNDKHLKFIKISAGDILRNHVFNNSLEKKRIDSGKLIANNIVFDLIKNFMEKHPSKHYLFDGFPRTLSQAKFFDINKIDIKYFIQLHLSEKKHIK